MSLLDLLIYAVTFGLVMAGTFAGAFNESAQFVLAHNEHFAPRREIVAAVESVAARVDKQRASAIAQSAAAQRQDGKA